MNKLLGNIRFYVLAVSLLWGIFVYLYLEGTVSSERLLIIRMTQWYALTSLFYLYITLFVGPFSRFYSNSFIQHWLKARRGLGVSAFFFGLLHGSLAFFGQLGGFAGLPFLDNRYLLAITFSFTALIILTIMASTSFDWVVSRLKFKRWKMIHRFVYLAGVLVLVHAVMLGTHFQDLSSVIPVLIFCGLVVLLLMHAILIDRLIAKKFDFQLNFGVVTLFIVGGLTFWYFGFVDKALINRSSDQANAFNVHAQHIQMAQEAQKGNAVGSSNNNQPTTTPGLVGDRTKRYTVSFIPPEKVESGKEVPLRFKVYDAASGEPVLFYQRMYEKIVHLIEVDSELNYFNHIHPEQKDNEFTITTSFPKDGVYHLYIDFQPLGAIEQQFGFSLNVGNVSEPKFSNIKPDDKLTKVFGNYEVSLDYDKPLKSAAISVGQQPLKFVIKDSQTGQPVTNLKPYLGAFGHLVMINQKTFEYVHVHPTQLTPLAVDANGGPEVEFLPLGLYGPIKPGIYRVFGQFNPDNKLFTSDFTIEVE